jgi:hypothetical protein
MITTGSMEAGSRRFALVGLHHPSHPVAGFRFPAPEAGFRFPAPEAGRRIPAPVAGSRRPVTMAGVGRG